MSEPDSVRDAGVMGQPRGNEDAIEIALANALTEAAAAGRFDVVGQLAKELESRRLARASNVVALDAQQRRQR